MTDRYTLSGRARWFHDNFDEITLADLCANYEAAARIAGLDHAATPHTLCANLRPGSHTTVCDQPAGHGNHRGATGYGERVSWPADDGTVAGGPHIYLSTGCHHGDTVLPDGRTGHQYCQAMTGLAGTKRPAECKFCQAPCQCGCHAQPVVSVHGARDLTPDAREALDALIGVAKKRITEDSPVVPRDPCPRCEGSPTRIPRHAMTDHMRVHHPEEQPSTTASPQQKSPAPSPHDDTTTA